VGNTLKQINLPQLCGHFTADNINYNTSKQIGKPRLKCVNNKNLKLGIHIDSKQNSMSMAPKRLIEMSSLEGDPSEEGQAIFQTEGT